MDRPDFGPGRRTQFSDDLDSDLLAYMAMQDDDPDTAVEAWEEFCFRHGGYLFNVCKLRGYARTLGGEDALEDLVQESLRRVYERAASFDDNGVGDPEQLRKRVRGWLGAIVRNLRSDLLRSAGQDALGNSVGPEPLEWAPVVTPDRRIESSTMKLGLEAWSGVLTDREREVLRTTAEFLKLGEKFQRLPNGVAQNLANSLGTTTAGLRMIRKRAVDKIRAYVEKRTTEGAS